ncbi:MAG: hypothetical protein ABIY70_21235 [Capsulimonas sp.]|uniref:hypothetical protein n=1 Tax=Capsulimonas sp. TaxID=2494211 RepID=UPI003267BF45
MPDPNIGVAAASTGVTHYIKQRQVATGTGGKPIVAQHIFAEGDDPLLSLSAVAASGDGNEMLFETLRTSAAMQTTVTGFTAAEVVLEATLNGTDWDPVPIAAWSYPAMPSGKIIHVPGVLIKGLRARLIDHTGAGTVSATIAGG